MASTDRAGECPPRGADFCRPFAIVWWHSQLRSQTLWRGRRPGAPSGSAFVFSRIAACGGRGGRAKRRMCRAIASYPRPAIRRKSKRALSPCGYCGLAPSPTPTDAATRTVVFVVRRSRLDQRPDEAGGMMWSVGALDATGWADGRRAGRGSAGVGRGAGVVEQSNKPSQRRHYPGVT